MSPHAPAATRRDFLRAIGSTLALAGCGSAAGGVMSTEAGGRVANRATTFAGGPSKWRGEFPALAQQVNGEPLVYLDSAATAQRPNAVIDALADFYRRDNANPGRTLHALARRSDERYERARATVARFINAWEPAEVVFTRGTTEAINLVAAAWGAANLASGDEIVLTVAEHYSNLLPWVAAARRAGATVRFVDVDDEGRVRLDHLDALVSRRTRIVAFSHVSNVLGLVTPAREICARAHAAGARVLVDGAQSAPHLAVDVRELGCDFFAFSGHKVMGPMGSGVLWGRRELLDAMPPYQSGSNMAHEVELDALDAPHYASRALKFGAGTPNVAGAVGLAAAVEFLEEVGLQALREHELTLTRHALERLGDVKGLRLFGAGAPEERISLFSFELAGIPAGDVLRALDARGIAVRAGDLASLPLLKRLGATAAVRASFYLYSRVEEVERLGEALRQISH